MSKLVKSHWGVSANHVQLTVPFAKVDQEKRLVSGFATLDNIDSQGDVVTAEASASAFARARGNIREMHQPIAAGRLVDFREDDLFDQETGKFYRGIFVTAYVSRGAEATWEKVLDGTLTGFSIGGEIKSAETQYVPEQDATVRFVKEYDLIELSLVDNPANQLANVFSIQKSAEGSVTLKGMVAETVVENVFWCDSDNVARTLNTDNADCLICGTTMDNIGWVENGTQKAEKVKEVVTKFLNRNKQAAENASEGGVTVQKDNNNETVAGAGEPVAGVDETANSDGDQQVSGAEGAEAAPREETGENAETTEDGPREAQVGEEVVGVDEVRDEAEELNKKMDALISSVDEVINKTREETTTAVSGVEAKVSELTKSMEAKFSELDSKLSELDKNLAAAKSATASVEDALNKFNSSGAIKKSGEVEKSAAPETVQKDDDWNGTFSVRSLFK